MCASAQKYMAERLLRLLVHSIHNTLTINFSLYYWNLFTKSTWEWESERARHTHTYSSCQCKKKRQAANNTNQNEWTKKKNPICERKHGDGTHKSIATNNIIYMAEQSAAMQRNSHELGTEKRYTQTQLL